MAEDVEIFPGTVRLFEEKIHVDSSYLKRDGEIVLQPQPTDSPNDPLNWPITRKYFHAILLFFITGFATASANGASLVQDGMNQAYGIPYDAMDLGGVVLSIGTGYWTFFVSPAAFLYGRRVPYLIGMTWSLIGAIWMVNAKDPYSLIIYQLFVGASGSTAEANVQLSLSEIFFEHQRGSMTSVYVLTTSVGTYLGSLVESFVVERLGWQWIGWLSFIISACGLILLYFGLEETMFDRAAYGGASEMTGDVSDNENAGVMDELEKPPSGISSANTLNSKRKPYWQRIKIITLAPNIKGTGFKQYTSRLWHNLRIFGFPAVIYSGIQWGAQDAWLAFYMTVEQDNWREKPWSYSIVQAGLMNIPCIIGAVLGCCWGGMFSDRFVCWAAKRRNGICEAEDRLWMMLPCALCSPAGMFIFGIGSASGWSWPPCYAGLVLVGFGWGCAGDLSMSYLMDAYPEMVLEGMVGVSVIDNSIGCIFELSASTWLRNSGVRDCFIALGVLDFLFIALTIPMIIYGKACRKWTLTRYLDFVKIRDSI